MLFFLTLTQRCNLSCTYCGSRGNADIEDLSLHPQDITYDLDDLKKLEVNNPEDPLILCFYGGEPLLKRDMMEKVVEMFPEAVFCLQTNGTFMKNVKTTLINAMDDILVSIDGDQRVTDSCRGRGTYDKILQNVHYIRDHGFDNDIVARMTVHTNSNIFTDVSHLLALQYTDEQPLFDHVHWQLDVLWDSPTPERLEEFVKWRDESYNPGISALINMFRDELSNNGKVLGIAPFLGVLSSLVAGTKVRLRCRAGLDAFNVATGGSITACPIAPELDSVGSVSDPDFHPESIKNSTLIGGLCPKCEVFGVCGGRCLYANKSNWWGDEGFELVCNTVKHLINELKPLVPLVKDSIAKGIIEEEDLFYPPYNNSVETIP